MIRFLTASAAAIALFSAAAVSADSFAPPSVQTATSPSGSVVVTVIPAMLSCAASESDCEPAARAIVEFDRGGMRGPSRTVRLRNREAPGYALVTDDGERLVTVNDYASAGFGDNVLVVYDERGEIIANHALADFLPEEYINGLPRTASTLRWWSAPVRLLPGTRQAIVSVYAADGSGDFSGQATDGIELRLDLDTGAIERPSGPEWQAARACALATPWMVPDAGAEAQRARFGEICRESGGR